MILSSTEAKHLQKENIVIQIKRKGSYWGLGVRNVREGNTLPLIFNSLSLLEPSSWCSKEVELKQSNAFKKHEMPLERSKIEKPSICDIWRYCLSEFSFRSKQKELCSISIFLRTSKASVSKLFFSISIFQNNLTKKVRAVSIMKSSSFLLFTFYFLLFIFYFYFKSVFEIFIYFKLIFLCF